MASSEGTGGGSESALFSKLGGAFFGGPNSPQKVIANVRGLLANRLTGAIPDTGNKMNGKLDLYLSSHQKGRVRGGHFVSGAVCEWKTDED